MLSAGAVATIKAHTVLRKTIKAAQSQRHIRCNEQRQQRRSLLSGNELNTMLVGSDSKGQPTAYRAVRRVRRRSNGREHWATGWQRSLWWLLMSCVHPRAAELPNAWNISVSSRQYRWSLNMNVHTYGCMYYNTYTYIHTLYESLLLLWHLFCCCCWGIADAFKNMTPLSILCACM